jgi:hypothetical protein
MVNKPGLGISHKTYSLCDVIYSLPHTEGVAKRQKSRMEASLLKESWLYWAPKHEPKRKVWARSKSWLDRPGGGEACLLARIKSGMGVEASHKSSQGVYSD